MKVLASGPLHGLRLRMAEPVRAGLVVGEDCVDINARIDRGLELRFSGAVYCTHCGARTTRSFARGFCFDCFSSLARCDLCVLSPDRCHRHLGTCREPLWGDRHCMRGHVVYLAHSSGLKVGITRSRRLPGRWLDQGAIHAVVVAWTGTRRIAGLLEQALAQEVNDRTDWRRMLQTDRPIDLPGAASALRSKLQAAASALTGTFGSGAVAIVRGPKEWRCSYPLRRLPYRPMALTAAVGKESRLGGVLAGAKGQYLVFDSGVLNVASHRGFEVTVFDGLPEGVPAQPSLL